MEPVEPDSPGGASSGLVMFLVVAGVALLVATIFLLVQVVGSGDTTVPEAAPTTTTASMTLPPPPTITGELAIETSFDSATAVLFGPGRELVEGTPCAAIDNDDDIKSGARMTVTDINGTLIGTGALGSGVLALKPNIEDRTVPTVSSSAQRKEFVYANADCVFGFTIPLVNEAEFYTITVGSGDGLTYSHLEMVSFGWILEPAR